MLLVNFFRGAIEASWLYGPGQEHYWYASIEHQWYRWGEGSAQRPKDCTTHPIHSLFTLLPPDNRYRSSYVHYHSTNTFCWPTHTACISLLKHIISCLWRYKKHFWSLNKVEFQVLDCFSRYCRSSRWPNKETGCWLSGWEDVLLERSRLKQRKCEEVKHWRNVRNEAAILWNQEFPSWFCLWLTTNMKTFDAEQLLCSHCKKSRLYSSTTLYLLYRIWSITVIGSSMC